MASASATPGSPRSTASSEARIEATYSGALASTWSSNCSASSGSRTATGVPRWVTNVGRPVVLTSLTTPLTWRPNSRIETVAIQSLYGRLPNIVE